VRVGDARGYPVQSVSDEFDPALLKFPQNFLSVAHRFFPVFSPADMSSILSISTHDKMSALRETSGSTETMRI
jgi:hypothetical protein